MKKIRGIVVVLLVAILLVACGGGGANRNFVKNEDGIIINLKFKSKDNLVTNLDMEVQESYQSMGITREMAQKNKGIILSEMKKELPPGLKMDIKLGKEGIIILVKVKDISMLEDLLYEIVYIDIDGEYGMYIMDEIERELWDEGFIRAY